jgi:hypothetical protein
MQRQESLRAASQGLKSKLVYEPSRWRTSRLAEFAIDRYLKALWVNLQVVV